MPLTRPIFAALVLLFAAPVHGQPVHAQPAEAPAAAPAEDERLPARAVTRHTLDLGDRSLAFTATAGAVTLTTRAGKAEADVAFTAYVLDGPQAAARPVTFAVNGGPGAASAYLQIGALGPWLLPMAGERIAPSQAVALVPNAETWLDFTDLVFIDPVGTGFSRLVDPDDALRGRYLSVDGDTDAIADFILKWLTENGRTGSPKYFVGESYGGFRGPLVAEALATDGASGSTGWCWSRRCSTSAGGSSRSMRRCRWLAAAVAGGGADGAGAAPSIRAALAEVEDYARGRLRHRPARRRGRRGGGGAARRPGDGADRARPRGGGADRGRIDAQRLRPGDAAGRRGSGSASTTRR